MRFLLDANLPRSATMVAQSLGHDAVNARDIGLGTAPDSTIAARAIADQAALITRDFDFADIRNYPPSQYHGLIILDLPDDALADQVSGLLATFLRHHQWLAAIRGRLAVVRPNRVRFRPPLTP